MRSPKAILVWAVLSSSLLALPVRAQEGAVKVNVRTGFHEGFVRLVFSGRGQDHPVPFTNTLDGDILTIRFERPVEFDVAAVRRGLGDYVASASLSAEGLTLTLALSRRIEPHQTRYDADTIAIDLVDEPKPEKVVPTAKPEQPKPERPAGKPEPAPKPEPAAAPRPEPVKPEKPAPPVKTEPTKLAPAPKSEPPAKVTAGKPPESTPPGKVPEPIAATPVPPVDSEETPPPIPANPVPIGKVSGNDLKMSYLQNDDGFSIRFDWQKPVAAVVFRRGAAVYVGFDVAQHIDFGNFRDANRQVVTGMEQVPTRSGTVLRIEAWQGFNPSVRRAGNAWIVDLKNAAQRAEAPIEPVIHAEGPNVSMIYPAQQPASPIVVVDPDAGDNLVLVPLPQLGQGSAEYTEMPDFRVLASAQGLVFRPVSDQLIIRSEPSDVEVAAPGGLTLSPPVDRMARSDANPLTQRLFNPPDWAGPPTSTFTQAKQRLFETLAQGDPNDRAGARLAIAEFYFANGLDAEALGVLQVLEHDSPDQLATPLGHGLRGAAEEMLGRLDLATTDLADPALDDKSDGVLWRAALAADKGDWPAAADGWNRSKQIFSSYSKPLQRYLATKLAEANFRAGFKDEAGRLAALVLAKEPSIGQSDLMKVLQGRIAGEKNDRSTALALWDEVAKSPDDDLGRAEAVYAATVTRLDQGEIARSDAIDALERLRFAWRGDDFEGLVMRKLSDLYVAENDFDSAFEMMKRITLVFPDSAVGRDAAERMQKTFVDVFLGKNADTVPPLKAVALYDQYKELTPAGAQGDAIIRKLADQLVKVDLLDRAGSLLETQVTTRLTGVEQARVAAQLALVRLLDQKPDLALKALDVPVAGPLPVDLEHQRVELRARALGDLGRADEGIKLLAGDDSPDADRLRTDIYWRTGNWSAAAVLLRKNLHPLPPDGTLDPTSARAVLNAATAMLLGSDRAGLDELQKTYGAAMDKTDYRADFRVVAGNGADPASFKTLADKVAQTGDLQSFMQSYRERLAQNQLSAVN
jgi:tetratricopeptide (TPR) repeat protein